MKKLLFTLLLIPLIALAQDDISISTGIIGGGKLLGAKTADNQTTVGILGIDSSGNTVIKALSGKTISIPGTMSLTGAVTTGALTVNPSADVNRFHIFTASSDTAHTYKFGDSGTTAAQTLAISASTADADDDSIVAIGGGGAALSSDSAQSRGAFCQFGGNESASTGRLDCQAGAVSGGNINFLTRVASTQINFGINATNQVAITDGTFEPTTDNDIDLGVAGTKDFKSIFFQGSLISSGTSDIGWTVQSAANQACNTTCTAGCVFGYDAGTTTIVDCASALSDKCVCAGAS